MPKSISTTELRAMSASDLRKEITDKRSEVAKMKMGVMLRSEKDTARFRREKKEIARMLTILGQIESASPATTTALKTKRKVSKVSAPAKAARVSASTPN